MASRAVVNAEQRALPRSKARDAQRIATRAAVVDAGIDLFAERGFEGTALPSIAAASGIPVPLMLYHFKSKALLWRDCVDEVYRRLEGHFEAHSERIAAAAGYDYFRASIRAHITALAACPAYMRILVLEGTRHTDRLSWLVETHQSRITARITALIARAQAERYLPPMDLIHAKFILSGAFCFPIVLAPEYRLIDDVDPESDAFIERHIELCLQLLMPDSASKGRNETKACVDG